MEKQRIENKQYQDGQRISPSSSESKADLIRISHEADIQKSLIVACSMMGLKPEAMEIQIASRFIKNNYPALQLGHISKAFELNSTGKYWEIIEHYGELSTLFIGKVLKAFQEAKRMHAVKHQPKRKQLPEAPPADPETAKEWMRKIRAKAAQIGKPNKPEKTSRPEPSRITFEDELEIWAESIPQMSSDELHHLKSILEKKVSLKPSRGGAAVENPYQPLLDQIEKQLKNT